MTGPVRDTDAMIAGMAPILRAGVFVFASSTNDDLAGRALAVFEEDEGRSLILPVEIALTSGLPTKPAMRCITLTVQSSLEGVGLTAAVSGALARAGIPANMVAALRHDHVFVPEDMAHDAMRILLDLAAGTR